jgi:hypothetical protein
VGLLFFEEEFMQIDMTSWTDFQKQIAVSVEKKLLCEGKRFEAVLNFMEQVDKVDEDILEKMPAATIWAPTLMTVGELLNDLTMPVIYLSPILEFEEQSLVDGTVAEEFAHLYLKHHELTDEERRKQAELKYEERPVEMAAIALAQKWGFKDTRKMSLLDSALAEKDDAFFMHAIPQLRRDLEGGHA